MKTVKNIFSSLCVQPLFQGVIHAWRHFDPPPPPIVGP